MTDSATATGWPGRKLPAPTFFDPSFERVPVAADFDDAHPGPVILLYDPEADRAWVADAAIALATGWTAGGRRTVLADLALENPVLHERIGMGNMEGIVDIFLYGASLARSARPVPGRGFYLITAGTYTDDAGAIFRHPRWEKIVAGFREAQASLLLFVPTDAPDLLSVGHWAEDVIVLGAHDDEELLRSVLLQGFSVRAWLTPPVRDGAPAAAPAPAPPPPARFPDPEPVPPWKAPPGTAAAPPAGDAAEYLPAAPAAEPLPVPDPTWEEAPPAKGPGRRRKSIPKDRKVSPVLLVLLVLALLVGAAAVGLSMFPGILGGAAPEPAPRAPARPAARPAAPRAAVAEAGTPKPYAVYVKAFQDFPTAEEFRAGAARRLPDVPFFVFPEETQGVVYHKVYAGVLADTVEAASLRQRLLDAEMVNPDDVGGPSALVQPRSLAFALGDFATREAAAARADSLAARGVPAYPVAVPLSDGTERWKLYAGAFADSAAAAPLKESLEAARLPAPLVQRTGRPPASPK